LTIYACIRDGYEVAPPGTWPGCILVRVTGRSGQIFRADVVNVAGEYVLALAYVTGIGDPYETAVFDSDDRTEMLAAPVPRAGIYRVALSVRDAAAPAVILDYAEVMIVVPRPENYEAVEIPDGAVAYVYVAAYPVPGVEGEDTHTSTAFVITAGRAPVVWGRNLSCLTILYNYRERLGRVFTYSLPEKRVTDTDWTRRCVVELTMEFPDENTMFRYLYLRGTAASAYPEELHRIFIREDVALADKIALMLPYNTFAATVTWVDRCLGVYRDGLKITHVFNIVFGGVGFAICVALLGWKAIAVAVGILIAAGAALYFMLRPGATVEPPLPEPPPQPLLDEIGRSAEEGIKRVKEEADHALTLLKELLDAGKIAPEDYEVLRKEIEELRDAAIEAIRDVEAVGKKMVIRAYDEGLGKGRLEGGLIGGAIGAVAGGAIGMAIGRRG